MSPTGIPFVSALFPACCRGKVSENKAKAHTQKDQTALEPGRKGARGSQLHKPGSRAVCGPMTYLAVCLFRMSDSILSSWLPTSVITLMLGNGRKQTPPQTPASQVARWGYSTPGMPDWAHPRLWQSAAEGGRNPAELL